MIKRALQYCSAFVAAFCALSPHALHAQKDGVSIGMTFGGDTKLRIVVDSVRGPAGDSLTAILSRDLDYSDRFIVLPSSSAPVSSGPTQLRPLSATRHQWRGRSVRVAEWFAAC